MTSLKNNEELYESTYNRMKHEIRVFSKFEKILNHHKEEEEDATTDELSNITIANLFIIFKYMYFKEAITKFEKEQGHYICYRVLLDMMEIVVKKDDKVSMEIFCLATLNYVTCPIDKENEENFSRYQNNLFQLCENLIGTNYATIINDPEQYDAYPKEFLGYYYLVHGKESSFERGINLLFESLVSFQIQYLNNIQDISKQSVCIMHCLAILVELQQHSLQARNNDFKYDFRLKIHDEILHFLKKFKKCISIVSFTGRHYVDENIIANFIQKFSFLLNPDYLNNLIQDDPSHVCDGNNPKYCSKHCTFCFKFSGNYTLQSCGSCSTVFYCDDTCRLKHWKLHWKLHDVNQCAEEQFERITIHDKDVVSLLSKYCNKQVNFQIDNEHTNVVSSFTEEDKETLEFLDINEIFPAKKEEETPQRDTLAPVVLFEEETLEFITAVMTGGGTLLPGE